MPPRRGGRGRGRTPARPPQVIRDSMTEVGMGSIAQFEAFVKLAASKNADASRAYFPPLKPENKPKPSPILKTEECLVKLYNDLVNTMRDSPMAIEYKQNQKESKIQSELKDLQDFYKTSSHNNSLVITKPSIWDENDCYVLTDVVPEELLSQRTKKARREKEHEKKRARLESQNLHASHENVQNQDTTQLDTITQFNSTENQNPETNPDERNEDENDPNPAEAGINEEEEDEQFEADFDTGVRFDDDDGYEEADSGAEEAIF